MKPSDEIMYANDLNALVKLCHGKSLAASWWHDLDHLNPHVVPTKIALIHSELCEAQDAGDPTDPITTTMIAVMHNRISRAMEGHRRDKMDDKLPHRKAIEVELADAIIRICDLAGWLKLDLGGALVEKVAYNDIRADHKEKARNSTHGKRY